MLICVVQTNLNARRLHDMGRSSRWPQILSYAILLIVFLEQMQNLHSDYETQIQRAHGLIATAFLFLWSIGSFVYGAICGFTRSDPKPNRWGGPRVALRLSAVTNVIGRGGEIFTHRRIRWPFWKHFGGYIIGFIGILVIGISVLSACGAAATDSSMVAPGIFFIVGLLLLLLDGHFGHQRKPSVRSLCVCSGVL